MPLKSRAQERYLWMKDPEVAAKFESETSKSQKASLPERVGKKKLRSKKRK